jgi:2-amino-4-hydroxy-6-hydroxymethyldihydropteridine diphosphokinase
MSTSHRYVLSLGSNIRPEFNLGEAIRRLQNHGRVGEISGIWESHAIGAAGPNFLNLCVEFLARPAVEELKREVANRIEGEMGRVRSADASAPRTIDIDILMVDGEPLNVDRWNHPFVLLPLSELLPEFPHPTKGVPLSVAAKEAEDRVWIVRRQDALPREVSGRES